MATNVSAPISRMSSEEYLLALKEIHLLPAESFKSNERREDLEFRLTLRYRLGANFDPDRLGQLVLIHKRMQILRDEAIKGHLAGRLSHRKLAGKIQAISDNFRLSIRSVLSPEEYAEMIREEF